MILLADSGSTKTEWRLLDPSMPPRAFRSSGINPYFSDSGEIASLITNEVGAELSPYTIQNVYFYGAGCGRDESASVVSGGLKQILPEATIEVRSDLLAAARSLAADQPALIAILGTGSNTCYYDGKMIREQVPSLGFILGDEGSGAFLGKKLLNAFFYREMEDELLEAFTNKFKIGLSDVLDHVYRQTYPSRYLASFVPFLSEYRDHKYCRSIIHNSFDEFFSRVILRYKNSKKLELMLTGSIAFHFADELKERAGQFDIRIGTISKDPVDGLVKYHLSHSVQ